VKRLGLCLFSGLKRQRHSDRQVIGRKTEAIVNPVNSRMVGYLEVIPGVLAKVKSLCSR
jgi:hypothetical protein